MANTDAPRGFRPYGELLHVGIYIAAGTIYPGDLVEAETGAANTTSKRMRVAAADDGPSVGVALNYATVGQVVRVADDPSQLFSGQVDAAEPAANSDLGLNYAIVATAGDSTYKQSRMEVSSTGEGTGATIAVKVLGVVDRQDGKNQFGNPFVEVIFKINNHQLGSSTGTAGV
jgi:hypothetical protein